MLSFRQIQDDFSIKGLLKTSPHCRVYKARDKYGVNYAMKIVELETEKIKKRKLFSFSKGYKEGRILSKIRKIQGIPKLYFNGKNPDLNSYIIVMQLYDVDLNKYYSKKKSFTFEYISMIGSRLAQILGTVHKKNVVHRDLKPDNILLNEDQPEEVFLADFGLSKILKKKKSTSSKCFVGNMKFASLAAHMGENIQKKDDMESLGYLIVYFVYDGVPWEGVENDKILSKIREIGEVKKKFLEEELDYLPKSLKIYFEYLKNLKNNSPINYEFLAKLLFELKNDLSSSKKIESPLKTVVSSNRDGNSLFEIDESLEFPDQNLDSKIKDLQIFEKFIFVFVFYLIILFCRKFLNMNFKRD